jgi:hypothetical protein
MRRTPDGRWIASLQLRHGVYRYLFVIDGKVNLDPGAIGTARIALNEQASLIIISCRHALAQFGCSMCCPDIADSESIQVSHRQPINTDVNKRIRYSEETLEAVMEP